MSLPEEYKPDRIFLQPEIENPWLESTSVFQTRNLCTGLRLKDACTLLPDVFNIRPALSI